MLRSLTTGWVDVESSTAVKQTDSPKGAFSGAFLIRHTNALAAPGCVFAATLVSSATVNAYIEKIVISLMFDANGGNAAKLMRYDLCRFSTATPTGGATGGFTPVLKQVGMTATAFTDVRGVDTGLTTTGVVFEAPFATIGVPISVVSGDQALDPYVLDFGTPLQASYSPLVIKPGEGFAILLNVDSVIGTGIGGFWEWSER